MDNTKFFEDIIIKANTNRLCEAREDTIGDFADLCADVLGISKVEHITKRNERTPLASYNEKDNAIYYHTDLLWLPVDIVRSIIAHEVAHAAAGYKNEHNDVWLSYYEKLKDAFPRDNIQIFTTVDELNDNKEIFSNLVPGRIMNMTYKIYPDIKGHVTVGFNTIGGLVDISGSDKTELIVRPTFYCADESNVAGYQYITDEDYSDAELAIEDVIDALESEGVFNDDDFDDESFNMYDSNTLFESIIREADKSRFLKPIYDKYSNDYAAIPEYESLLKFVNNDPFMSGFDWQQMFKSFRNDDDETAKSYFDSIINKYQKRWDERERKTSEKLALHNGNIAEMARAKGFKVVDGEDSSDADFAVLSSLETDKYSFIVPLNWEAAQFCDSFECGGEGAKWCIGMKDNNAYWDEYTEQGNLFILVFNKDVAKKPVEQREENTLKYMIQISATPDETQAWTQDDNHSNVIRMENFGEFFGRSVVSMVEAFVNSVLCDDTAFNNGRYSFTEEDDLMQPSIPWTDDELEGNY